MSNTTLDRLADTDTTPTPAAKRQTPGYWNGFFTGMMCMAAASPCLFPVSPDKYLGMFFVTLAMSGIYDSIKDIRSMIEQRQNIFSKEQVGSIFLLLIGLAILGWGIYQFIYAS